MKRGLFITLEGGEGSGKTTASHKIKGELEKLGHEVVLTREPGGVVISEQIRNIILSDNNYNIDHMTEALLFASARRQHLVEKVIPAINQGKIVICDRFIDSSLVYQGLVNGTGVSVVSKINEFAIDGHMPHLTLFFDISAKKGLERVFSNSEREVNRLDEKDLQFHKNVYNGYKMLNYDNPRVKTVNAEATVEEVVKDCLKHINKLL